MSKEEEKSGKIYFLSGSKTSKTKSNSVIDDSSFGKRLDFSAVNFPQKSNFEMKNTGKTEQVIISENSIKRRQEEYNKNLRKDPKNVSHWHEFLHFQDQLFNDGQCKGRKLIERKISVLRRAIEFNPTELEFIFLHLKLSEEIEDSSTIMKLWNVYLKKCKPELVHEDYFKLTLKWLEFLQNRFLAFSFDQVNVAFEEAFKSLNDSALYTFYFKFLKRTGYIERIIATCQGIIEVNIENYKFGEVDLDGYEDQWDCGLMDHIGDSIFHGKPKPSLYPNITPKSANILSSWLRLEKYRQKHYWHPLNFEEDDFEGQIIFDDIKNFLIIPENQKDSILLIEIILKALKEIFHDDESYENFAPWFLQVQKTLLPFFMKDWKFIFRLFSSMSSIDEAEEFSKTLLSNNRNSLECFMAYGKFQESLGNIEMASKVYESIRNRSVNFNFESNESKITSEEDKGIVWDNLNFDPCDIKSSVYELIRSNPGNKNLYMKIIEATVDLDESLSMEVFNLIDEQQLRVYTLLEEINQ